MKKESCPLCQSQATLYAPAQKRTPDYYGCPTCAALFVSPQDFLSPEAERAHYLSHNNDVNNQGYQGFVSPITDAIQLDFGPEHKGLDFGAGTGPVIQKLLQDAGYQVQVYDPFFHPNTALLQKASYDYIACCEVIEHFHQPAKEFRLLRQLLRPNGKLYCKTHPFDGQPSDFAKWYYRYDPSHVFFYREATFAHIAAEFGFQNYKREGRLIVFSCD